MKIDAQKNKQKSYIVHHYFSNLYHGNLFLIKSITTKLNNKYANIQNTTLK